MKKVFRKVLFLSTLHWMGCATMVPNQQSGLLAGTQVQERLGIYLYNQGDITGRPQLTIFFHGAGGAAESLAHLVQPGENQIFLFPNLPYVDPFTAERGGVGYLAWPRYPLLQPDKQSIIAKALSLESSSMMRLIQEFQTKYGATEQVNIVGFSQGGVQAYHLACTLGKKADRLILWASPTRHLTFDQFPNLRTKIVLLHNEDDEVVPLKEERTFYEQLKKMKYNIVSDLKGVGGHSLTSDYLKLLRKQLMR